MVVMMQKVMLERSFLISFMARLLSGDPILVKVYIMQDIVSIALIYQK